MSSQLQNPRNHNVSDFEKPSTLVKTVREFEEVLKSSFIYFPCVVITEIASFAQFKKEQCWRCEESVWEEFAAEIDGFTIWASGYYPPEIYACKKCRELRWAWACHAEYKTEF